MRAHLKNNVLQESRKRIRTIYKEGWDVIVGFSGGKDSTVILELTIEIARELNRLPVKAYFLDQESEYNYTIEYMRRIRKRKEVELFWYQIPFKLFNALSIENEYLMVWEEGREDIWMRQKEKKSIHNTKMKEDRFFPILEKLSYEIMGKDHLVFTGLRAEESMQRLMNMCKNPINGRSWFSRNKYYKNTFRCYPIYDWKSADVWKYIGRNKIDYNKIYDKFYCMGISAKNARVSSIIHEMGVLQLQILQEIEPETYNKLMIRVPGVGSYGKCYADLYKVNHISMGFKFFKNPKEYICYIIEMLCKEEHKEVFYNAVDKLEELCTRFNLDMKSKYMSIISTILLNDFSGSKLANVIESCYVKKK